MWILFIIAIVIILVICFKFRKPKKTTLLCYAGGNGTGKTFNGTHDALKFYKSSLRAWKRVNKPFFLRPLYLIPYFNKKRLNEEFYGLEKPCLYSSYPIRISRNKFSLPLTNDIMFLRKSIPLGSQVVIDEFSSWISQFEYNDVFSSTLNDHIQKWRHYHGNLSHLIVMDQCTNNIPIQVRYRLNEAVICNSTKHYFKFIHITSYKCIQLTDDIKSIEVLDKDDSDTDDKTLRIVRFSLSRKYDERAYSNRYWYVDFNPLCSKLIDSPLKSTLCLPKPMPKEKYPNLDINIKLANKERELSKEQELINHS